MHTRRNQNKNDFDALFVVSPPKPLLLSLYLSTVLRVVSTWFLCFASWHRVCLLFDQLWMSNSGKLNAVHPFIYAQNWNRLWCRWQREIKKNRSISSNSNENETMCWFLWLLIYMETMEKICLCLCVYVWNTHTWFERERAAWDIWGHLWGRLWHYECQTKIVYLIYHCSIEFTHIHMSSFLWAHEHGFVLERKSN